MKGIFELFRKPANPLESGGTSRFTPDDSVNCPKCGRQLSRKQLAAALETCPHCGRHFRLSARQRLRQVVDAGSFTELFDDVVPVDSLNFPGYAEKLKKAAAQSGERESVVCGEAKIAGCELGIFVMEPAFMMGSLSGAAGERLTRLFELAADRGLPVVGFCASGGARMQEGTQSLMQMAKVSGAVRWHGLRGNLYISVLTDPTTGGVTASFASLGDIILAEPGALIGFAGRRVIEQTTGRKLPEGFQSAEMLLNCGFIDRIVPRERLRDELGALLKLHERRGGR